MVVLSAAEVQETFQRMGLPFRFSAQELARWDTTKLVVPGRRVFGFPTPTMNAGLSLLKLRDLLGVDAKQPPSFFDHPWYLEEAFAHSECTPGWHFLQMDPVDESIGSPINYYRRFEAQGWVLPSAIEVVLMLFLHFVRTGEQLLTKKHTWCSDTASLDRCVTVGAFGRNGVFISGHPASFWSRGLGICAKWRLEERNDE
jgi:hypothetical protein